MKKSTKFMAGLLAALATSFTAQADHLADRLTFSARLQAAPGVNTMANGVAAFMLNSTQDTMYFTTSFAKLSSTLTGYHIHNQRTGGNVVIDFDGKVSGNTVRSFITGNQLKEMLGDFIAGNLYVAVHSQNNPAVEILGFVKLESDWGFEAKLDGMQASTNSMANGLAAINFGLMGDTASVRVVTTLGNNIESAHLHFGKEGQSGGVALDVATLVTADGKGLLGGVSISPMDWTNLMAALMNDSIYLNLHTAAFPNGEIRGQVRTTKTLRFDSWLSTNAITAGGGTLSKPSMGYGVSTLWLNNTMDTLRYQVFYNQLTSMPNAAHFHMGEPTQSGGVVKELTVGANSIMGVWTKYDAMQPLTSAILTQLLYGNLYFVIHTDSNPNGEIRGQVFRLAREGFIAELDGKQNNNNSMGMGSGVLTYDRDRMNLHYMITFDNLSSEVTAAHLHKGVKGENGGVVYDLNMPTNNGFYGYWKNGFNNAQSLPLRRGDSIYVNIHTANFPNGEIRGQFWRNYRISSPTMSTGVLDVIANQNAISLYPNPVNNELNVTFEANQKSNGTVNLYDINGRLITLKDSDICSGLNNLTLNTEVLKPGLYVVELMVNGEVVTRKKIAKE